MPLDRLKRKLTKEVLWIYILSLLTERQMYGYEISAEIKKRFNFEPATITTYVVLYSLERSGYVKSNKENKRRYYQITDDGKELMESARDFIESVLEIIFGVKK